MYAPIEQRTILTRHTVEDMDLQSLVEQGPSVVIYSQESLIFTAISYKNIGCRTALIKCIPFQRSYYRMLLILVEFYDWLANGNLSYSGSSLLLL